MPPRPTPDDVVRASLMIGLVERVAERGYTAVTINDIVDAAHVSKSTFYAQFAGKEDCYLAAYDVAADVMLNVIVEAASQDLPYEQRVLEATAAYMERAAGDPATAKTFIREVFAAGPAALAKRDDVNRKFAGVLRDLVREADDPEIHPLTEAASMLIVGGANELVLTAIADDRMGELPSLAPTVADAVLAAVTRHPTPR